MARRKRIAVEERTLEQRLDAAARYLAAVDTNALDKVVTAAEAFVAINQQRDGELESEGVFRARIARICGRVGEAN